MMEDIIIVEDFVFLACIDVPSLVYYLFLLSSNGNIEPESPFTIHNLFKQIKFYTYLEFNPRTTLQNLI